MNFLQSILRREQKMNGEAVAEDEYKRKDEIDKEYQRQVQQRIAFLQVEVDAMCNRRKRGYAE